MTKHTRIVFQQPMRRRTAAVTASETKVDQELILCKLACAPAK